MHQQTVSHQASEAEAQAAHDCRQEVSNPLVPADWLAVSNHIVPADWLAVSNPIVPADWPAVSNHIVFCRFAESVQPHSSCRLADSVQPYVQSIFFLPSIVNKPGVYIIYNTVGGISDEKNEGAVVKVRKGGKGKFGENCIASPRRIYILNAGGENASRR